MIERALDCGKLPTYLGYRLRRAQAAAFADFERRLGPLGISPGQFGLLALIAANPGISQIELARAVGRDKSTISPAIDRLRQRRLLTRRRSEGDRRAAAIALTRDGEALLHRLEELVEEHERSIAADLTDAERQTLLTLLGRVAGTG
jgi:DNA-binding MarR family transcriptional regulator